MTLNVTNFVYGDIQITDVIEKPNVKKLFDDHGNSMEITIGDNLICCSNARFSISILTGIFDSIENQNILKLNSIWSIPVSGCAYIGKLID